MTNLATAASLPLDARNRHERQHAVERGIEVGFDDRSWDAVGTYGAPWLAECTVHLFRRMI